MAFSSKSLALVARVLGKKYDVNIKIGRYDTAATDGNTIFLPLVEGEEALTFARGYIDHESAHLRLTDFDIMPTKDFKGALLNIIEDIRVEKGIAKDYSGCASNLRNLWVKLNEREGVFQPNPINPSSTILSWIMTRGRVDSLSQESMIASAEASEPVARAIFGSYFAEAQRLLETIKTLPEGKSGTKAAADLRDQFIQLLDQAKEDIDNQPPPPQPQEEPEKEEKEEEEEQKPSPSDQPDPEESEPESEESTEGEPTENADDQEVEEKEEDSSSSNSDGENDPSSDSEPETDAAPTDGDAASDSEEDGEENEQNESGSNPEPGDDSADTDGGEANGKGDSKAKNDSETGDDPANGSADGGEGNTEGDGDANGGTDSQGGPQGETEGDDSGASQEQSCGTPGGHGPGSLTAREMEVVKATLEEALGNTEVQFGDIGELLAELLNEAAVTDETYEVIPRLPVCIPHPLVTADSVAFDDHSQVKSHTAKLRAQLNGLIQASKLKRSVAGRSGRKIDNRILSRIRVGDDRLFIRREEKKGVNTAVLLVMDGSSSMYNNTPGEKMYTATRSCYVALDAMYSIPGVTSAAVEFNDIPNTVYNLCGWGQKPDSKLFNHDSARGTELSTALWFAWGELLARPEPRKIAIIFSDGDTGYSDKNPTRAAIQRMKADGIELVGIGIQDTNLKDDFLPKETQVIDNLDELTPALLKLLKEKLVDAA